MSALFYSATESSNIQVFVISILIQHHEQHFFCKIDLAFYVGRLLLSTLLITNFSNTISSSLYLFIYHRKQIRWSVIIMDTPHFTHITLKV